MCIYIHIYIYVVIYADIYIYICFCTCMWIYKYIERERERFTVVIYSMTLQNMQFFSVLRCARDEEVSDGSQKGSRPHKPYPLWSLELQSSKTKYLDLLSSGSLAL